MYVHQCLPHFQGTSHLLFLGKKRYLVTLRYCEISITEYPLVWVCFNILFLSLPLMGLRTYNKFLFLSFFFNLFFVVIVLLFAAFWVHLHVRLVYWSWLPYSVEGTCPGTCLISVTDATYWALILDLCGFINSHMQTETTLLRVWANVQLLMLLFLFLSLHQYLIKLESSGLILSFPECSLLYLNTEFKIL